MLQLHTMKMRLILIIIGVSFITMIGIGGFFIYNIMKDNEALLEDYREDLTRACETKLISETETAVSVINEYYKKQQRGELTQEQAKKWRLMKCVSCAMTKVSATFGLILMRA